MDKLISIITEEIERLLAEKGPFNIPSNEERGGLVQSKRTMEPAPEGHPDAEAFFDGLAKKRRKKKSKTKDRSEDS